MGNATDLGKLVGLIQHILGKLAATKLGAEGISSTSRLSLLADPRLMFTRA